MTKSEIKFIVNDYVNLCVSSVYFKEQTQANPFTFFCIDLFATHHSYFSLYLYKYSLFKSSLDILNQQSFLDPKRGEYLNFSQSLLHLPIGLDACYLYT